MNDSKYQLMCLFNEYFGRRTHFCKSENIDAFYQMASENYGIKTTPEEVKECFDLFVKALTTSKNYYIK